MADSGFFCVLMQVKKSTKCAKIFDAYAAETGIDRKSMYFMFEGENPAAAALDSSCGRRSCFLLLLTADRRPFMPLSGRSGTRLDNPSSTLLDIGIEDGQTIDMQKTLQGGGACMRL